MVSLTNSEIEYINNFYEKDGDISIIKIDKTERLCIISIPIFDGQEDIMNSHKIITIPIDYYYDGENIDIYKVPNMINDDDINNIVESIQESY